MRGRHLQEVAPVVEIGQHLRDIGPRKLALGTELQTHDQLELAEGLVRRLEQRHPELTLESWSSSYGELFDAVRLEKVLMFLTLLMVVAVATFTDPRSPGRKASAGDMVFTLEKVR